MRSAWCAWGWTGSFGLAMLLLATIAGAEPMPDPAELPRIPPKTLEEAQTSFQVREGFRVELAAGEPEVVDPVAIAFDAAGRMFVAEMRGYPERRDQALGRIKRLEDADGDGRYEKATIFADGLKWPTGVVCWGDGVFVPASPDILYLADRDGDGIAEERKVVFTGFGAGREPRLNMQALVNNLQWGPDGRIYGSTAANGGIVKRGGPGSEPIRLQGSDFSFDPKELDLRPESGTGQYGLTFDDFGRRYLCSNSRHLIAVMYSWPWNQIAGLPHPLVDIPVDGGAAEVYRISEVEPWRVVRTRWRVQGLVGGPVEGGGRAAGYFTSASGLTVYRGDAFPSGFRGDVFVGDVGSNLVHRKVIEFPANRVQPVAHRAKGEEQREFLASPDNWFRPVQCANGPDGALYIVDMYRETIEHPWSIPESIKKHLDLYSGNDRGRIWRVVPEDFERPRADKLSDVAPANLVAQLESPNGWRRDTAARLLIEKAAGDEAIEQDVGRLSLPEDVGSATRTQCLHLIKRFGRLRSWFANHHFEAFGPEVRAAVVRLIEKVPPQLAALAGADPDPRVRFELALRALDQAEEIESSLLASLVREAQGDPWIVRTVAVAARRRGVLTEIVLAQDSLATATALLESAELPEGPELRPLFERAAVAVAGEGTLPGERRAAGWLLARDRGTPTETLWKWVDGDERSLAAIGARALVDRKPDGWEAEVLARWERMAPGLREIFLNALSSSALVNALEEEVIRPVELDFQRRRTLLSAADGDLRKRADAVLDPLPVASRKDALETYRRSLLLDGVHARGAQVYTQRCALCHEKKDDRGAIGPELATLRNKGAPMLLENIIVPDREVAPQFVLWEIQLEDGASEIGMIANESSAGLTVIRADGTRREVARDEVIRLTNLNRSLMPVGLEAGLSVQEMADLLAYLTGDAGE